MSAVHPRIFVVFGMPRTGTTYLYHVLGRHPGVFVPYRKESHYFSVNYRQGEAWFAHLYDGMPANCIGADINPMYYLDPRADERLAAYDPDVKVILGVREPVEFAISLYGNMRAHGLDVPDILSVARGFDWPITPEEGLRFALTGSFMRQRVQALANRFGANLLLYDYAAFDASPLPVLRELERHVGLQAHFDAGNIETARINASGRRDPLGMNTLLANQRLLDVLYAVLPKAAIRVARRALERFAARGIARREPADVIAAGERAALAAMLAEDVDYYRGLFNGEPVRRFATGAP